MRVYNFSAGPAVLPEEVLKKAASELFEYKESGQSVMEMSHRSKDYEPIIFGVEKLFREVAGVPDNYRILFIQGGASIQFAMVPLNLRKNGKADYVLSGQFSTKAYQEGGRLLKANAVASSKDKAFSYIPELDPSKFDKDADFFHICMNNTIYGTRFTALPETGGVPLVADMSSCILSEPYDVSKFGVIYAGAQKNMGPAGFAVVVIRDDLVREIPEQEKVPAMLQYKTYADNDSMYNTPPTYGIYMLGLVLEWVRSNGGVSAMKEYNEKKAGVLYDYLDKSKLFIPIAAKKDRSLMNVTFKTTSDGLDEKFIKEAKAAGFINLKGHRSAGGMRASIYNAMPIEGIEKLTKFMAAFENNN